MLFIGVDAPFSMFIFEGVGFVLIQRCFIKMEMKGVKNINS